MKTFEEFNNNINENINITSSLKGVKEYRNGLTPETVMKEFPWLLKAKFKDAILSKDDRGLIWEDGIW